MKYIRYAGIALMVLGAAVMILFDWDMLSQSSLLLRTLSCLGVFLAYVIPSLAILVSIRFLTKTPSFITRKRFISWRSSFPR